MYFFWKDFFIFMSLITLMRVFKVVDVMLMFYPPTYNFIHYILILFNPFLLGQVGDTMKISSLMGSCTCGHSTTILATQSAQSSSSKQYISTQISVFLSKLLCKCLSWGHFIVHEFFVVGDVVHKECVEEFPKHSFISSTRLMKNYKLLLSST